MSQNTRLLLVALAILVVFGIFLQSLIARSLQESFGENNESMPKLPPANPKEAMPGIPPTPGAIPIDPATLKHDARKPAKRGK